MLNAVQTAANAEIERRQKTARPLYQTLTIEQTDTLKLTCFKTAQAENWYIHFKANAANQFSMVAMTHSEEKARKIYNDLLEGKTFSRI